VAGSFYLFTLLVLFKNRDEQIKINDTRFNGRINALCPEILTRD